MRVVTVQAVGTDTLGTTVKVTFAGNIADLLGHGGLQQAVIAVVLRSNPASGLIAGVATRGAGRVGETVVRNVPPGAGVVRKGRTLLFFLPLTSVSTIDTAQVKVFARQPGARSSRSLATGLESAEWWEKIDKEIADREATADFIDASAKEVTCDNVRQWLSDVRRAISDSLILGKTLTALGQDIDKAIAKVESKLNDKVVKFAAWDTVINPFNAGYTLVTGKSLTERWNSWKDMLRSLKLDRAFVDALQKKNAALVARLEALIPKLQALLEAVCNPPAPIFHIDADFDPEERSTTYTARGPGGVLGTGYEFVWTLTPPLNDPGCNNKGGLTSTRNYFDWYHGDDVCNHAVEVPGLGHAGVVRLVLENEYWTCRAAISGTLTANGDDAVCERR